MGLLFVPLTILAVSGVPRHETGAASSLLNVMQQVGGSLGLSILTHGISNSFQLAVVFAALALAVALVVVRARAPQDVPVESS
jgi:ABC-type Fe3+ transport system permease subunit